MNFDSVSHSKFTRSAAASAAPSHTVASVYGKSKTSAPHVIDKSSMIWKDFIAGVKRRRALVSKLREAATDSSVAMMVLKRQLLEVRDLTLTLIEDALEIEYRFQMFDPNSSLAKTGSKASRLPPISSFRSMEEKEDIFALADMINDVDVLFTIPNIKVMLPRDFPNSRNPFLLGKSVDELANLVAPNPEPGNADEELKVLELLRYKRASRALIRAEAQVMNNLPLTLHDMERLLIKMNDDPNVEKLVRSVCTLLDNDRTGLVVTESPELRCMTNPIFNIEGYDLLARLNRFKGVHPMRIDVQVVVRQMLQDCNFDYLDDAASRFLLDWINLILSQSLVRNRQRGTDGQTALNSVQSGKHDGPERSGILTKRTLQDRKNAEYADLASEVSSANYNRGTHEGIYNDPAPRMKIRASSPASALAQAQSQIGAKPDSRGRRGRTSSDEFGTGAPIEVAIMAGKRAAQQSSRPSSRQDARSPTAGGYKRDTSGSPTGGAFVNADFPPLHETSSPKHGDVVRFDADSEYVDRKQVASPTRASSSASRRGMSRLTASAAALRKVEAEEAKVKLREEIEKVVRQMGLATAKKTKNGMTTKDEEDLELDRLSSVRYELHRMQQELLRRQVLDPRHYQVMSVDAIAQAQSGLTVNDVNTSHPDETLKQKLVAASANAQKLVTLSEKTITTVKNRDGSRTLTTVELLLDMLGEAMIARINSVVETGGEEMVTNESIISGNVSISQRTVLKRDIIAHTKITKLIFNRLTDYLLMDIASARRDLKGKMLQNIFDELSRRALEKPPLTGNFLMKADRVLMSHKFTEDGVLVDVIIMRNDACDGLVIHCTPLAGIYNAAPHINPVGPVTILLHDKELQVLLINQYGLFVLSRSKWSSLVMVANWLSGRLKVRKVKTVDTSALEDEDEAMRMSGDFGDLVLEEPSFVSQVTFDNTGRAINAEGTKESTFNLEASNNSSPIKTMTMPGFMDTLSPQRLKTPMTATGGRPGSTAITPQRGLSQLGSRGRSLAMLDVQLDRRVDVSSSLQTQWKSRNVPNIAGMEMIIHAWQDLEMLVIRVTLTLPLPHRFNLLKRKKMKESRKSDNLLDMANFSDDEEELSDAQIGQVEPVNIELVYRLTSAELAIFGSAEMLEQKKITLSQNMKLDAEQEHPETFIWNVLSRLRILFKGSTSSPFERSRNANDPENWEVQYVRKLVRDVKTVSKGVMVVTASAIGGELLFEAEPLDNSVYSKVGSKIMTELEISETVYTEGWSLKLLDYHQRKDLALKMLDKLKVVDEDTEPRLEIYTFPETRMLKIAVYLGPKDAPQNVGSVEINYHSTLSDVRVLIKHELDIEDVPKQFRFMYKGANCSVKQEPFRRAWESLPMCLIVPKAIDMKENGTETEDILRRREKNAAKKVVVDLPKLAKGQRRVFGKFSAVPVPTLCYVTEGFPEVHLLHNVEGLFAVGDIIRIGNVLGRDYIVMPTPEAERERYPKTMLIGPAYDLVEEADFSAPIQYNLAYPKKNAGKYYDPNLDFSYSILKTPAEQGFDYSMPAPELEEFLLKGGDSEIFTNPADGPGGGLGSVVSELDTVSYPTEISGRVMAVSGKKDKKSSLRPLNQPFPHTWIWKCIPSKEDNRPKWRVLYDNGSVPYMYEYRNSQDFEQHFRVKASHAYLEVLCTDSRVPEFTLHAQRVRDMEEIPLEFYTQLIFDKMTEWAPQYRKGIERSKFIKLMREVNAFPDLKRSARVSQLEMYFTRVLKSDYGIVSKFINYAGFCHLLKEVSLIRFPPPKRQKDGDDNASVGSLDENASIGSMGSLNEGSIGSLGSAEKKSIHSGEGSESTQTVKKGENKKKAPAYATRKGKRRKLDKENEGDDMSVGASVVDTDPIYVLNAFSKFVMEFIMMFPDWYDIAWNRAKMMAMRREAIPYCAATRIAAKIRGGQARKRYLFFLKNHIILQANIRRKLSAKKTAAFVALLRQDWVFRMRYYCALKIQTLVRKFCKRCWFHRAIQKIKDNEYAVQKARRFRLKKLRAQARKGILYKELKRINGIMVFIRLTRQDTRNYTRDCGLIIEVYVPYYQSTFRFPLDDAELRFYMQIELGVEAVSVGDLLDKRNLQRLVASRLMVHKPNSKIATTQVIFSKHGLGQRGENTLTQGKRIKGEFFICKVFETGDDIAVQCYHRHTCKIFNVNMSVAEMRGWIVSEHRMHAKDDLERYSDPPVLHPKNKQAYYQWVLNGITIDTRKGAFNVIFALHLLKSRKKEMILRIQAAWRKALVRPRIVKILDQILLKVKVAAHDYNTYYLNRQTGATSWYKSKLLGPADIPTQPVCEWVPLTYFDKDGVEKTHYVNPYNGLYTSLVPDQAARIIQALIRNFLLKAISMPVAHFVKAGKIYRQAEKQYYSPNKRLAAVINFAMVTQLIELNEELAKKVYAEAVELSEANPLVTRAWGFYMLTTCEPPIKLNRERAHMLFSDARRKDEYHDKFKVAYYLYQFACIRFPTDPRTLVNLAVVQCLLYGNNYSAERLLRRALAIAPFEERVMEMWNFLKDRFPERQLVYNPNSRVQKADIPKDGKQRIIHGRPVKENPRWAGWVYVEKDTYNVSKKFKDEPYWYNPADGSEELDPPDFAEQWIIRRNRSQFEGERYGLEQYFDPLTSEYFQYHALTKTFA